MGSLIILLIPAIFLCSIILIEDWYKKRRGIETDSGDVLNSYIYVFVVIEMWL